jgi:hypothetical protein
MKDIGSSLILVIVYQAIWRHIPVEININSHRNNNLKYCFSDVFVIFSSKYMLMLIIFFLFPFSQDVRHVNIHCLIGSGKDAPR